MPEPSDPIDRLLDLFVYAPIGFVLSARTVVPEFVARGRSELEAPVTTLRLLGAVAARQGRVELERLCQEIRTQPVRPTPADGATEATPAFPIDDYDTMTAAQVLAVLGDLSTEQLAEVRRHEAAGRGRRTVLTRIDHLTSR